MGFLPPAYRRGWIIFCMLAAVAGIVYGQMRAPKAESIESFEVMQRLSPGSLMLIRQAPANAALRKEQRDGFSVPVPAISKQSETDAFVYDYVGAAHAVLAEKRVHAWSQVLGAVIGACGLAFLAALALSRRGSAT